MLCGYVLPTVEIHGSGNEDVDRGSLPTCKINTKLYKSGSYYREHIFTASCQINDKTT